MSLLKLRGYQQECIDAIHASLAEHTRVAAVLPTGAGKTVVFAHLIDAAIRSGAKPMVLVHREELAEQAKTKIHSVAPHLTVGIVKAERNEVDADVIVASVQTLVRPERRQSITDAGEIGIVIVDECHHAVARTWMEVLAHFGCFDDPEHFPFPDLAAPVPCVGFTATLTRQDGKGLGDVWETVAFERDINWMIDHGYLTDVRGQAITVDGLDLATIARSRGDYQEGELGNALIESGAAEVVAEAYKEHASIQDETGKLAGEYWKQGVIFAPTVASAWAFHDAMNIAGIPTSVIDGSMSSENRTLIYKRYEAGEIRVLANCMVLTEGWDAPWCEVAVIARPTSSAALYTQMVGRVLRPWQGKDEALVLDVVGISGRHKLQSLTDLVKTTVLDGESYAEARARVEKEQAERIGAIAKVSGLVKSQQVELFANSHSTWLMTKGGKWFIPVTHGVFFLWPALDEDTPGTWRLGYKAQDRNGARQNGWVESNMTLEYAMAWGEQLAELDDPTVSLKDRAWRRTKPSEGQIKMATRLKVAPIDELMAMRKGAVSDLLSVHIASRMLDI